MADPGAASRSVPVAAIVVAGGGGRRLGGLDKPGLSRAGTTLLDVALAAVRPARDDVPATAVVVVGPPRPVPDGVVAVREDPPGGGPAAAVAAGVAALTRVGAPSGTDGPVVLLAADLPRLTAATVGRLVRALADEPGAGAAVLVDDTGRRQLLLAAWRTDALRRAVDVLPDGGHGRPLRSLYDGVPVVEVPGRDDEWADVDTPDDRDRWWPAG